MNTKIFEHIMENNFGGKIPSKGDSYIQKSDSFEFRNFVKDKTLQVKTNNAKLEQKRIETNGSKRVSETRDAKQDHAEVQDNADVTQRSTITTIPIVERASLLEEMTSVAETKENAIQEEVTLEEEYILQDQELSQFDKKITSTIHLPEEHDKEAEFLNSTDNTFDEENIVTPVSTFVLDKLEVSENINDKITPAISEPLVIPKLPEEDQTIHHRLKTFELPKDFTLDNMVKEAELLTDTLQSKEIRKLEALSAKLETPIKLVIEDESRKNITDNTKPIIITPSLKLALADTTKYGKEVISKMHAYADDQVPVSDLEVEDFILNNKASLFNLSDKNNTNAGQRKSSSLETFGAVMEQTNDGTFEITFEGHNNGLKRSEIPKPPMQVSLAVREALNSSSDSGKKQITINLHPHTLGAVKVEILSQMSQDGVSKIESIKISADKHETLVMLEERKADLSKSLKEVNGAQEKEASLQFEMSQDQGKGQGTYFTSIEERDNWMSKFAGLISDIPIEEKQVHIVDEYATRGIVTEDKVDLIA